MLDRDDYSVKDDDVLELIRGRSSPRGRISPAGDGWPRRSAARIAKSWAIASSERRSPAVEIHL
ncbi:MAG TPA: hypothetical protein VF469_30525 [Kofleriaceae bacterium]